MSLLCGGSPDDRIRAAFSAHAEGNGIDIHAATSYLESVYRVVFTIDPTLAQRVNMSPDRLAIEATRRMFTQAELNADGTVSFEEFQRWYGTQPDVHTQALREGFRQLGHLHGGLLAAL